jgi:hypothetical protein
VAYPFISARWYTNTSGRKITHVVIHTTESGEYPGAARDVARYFQQLPKTRKASAHYVVDSREIVQCVEERDIAYHAPPLNEESVGVELCAKAGQTAAQWADDYSNAELALAAGLVRGVCHRYGIPVRFVDAAGLKAGVSGITTHVEVSRAFRVSDHWDPGPNFPMARFLSLVAPPAPVEVKPMFDPALQIVAALDCPTGGVWQLAPDGAVYAWAGAPYLGGANGQSYFVGRTAARLELHPSGGYSIIATSGEVYSYPKP